jgi:hypothetical protein
MGKHGLAGGDGRLGRKAQMWGRHVHFAQQGVHSLAGEWMELG